MKDFEVVQGITFDHDKETLGEVFGITDAQYRSFIEMGKKELARFEEKAAKNGEEFNKSHIYAFLLKEVFPKAIGHEVETIQDAYIAGKITQDLLTTIHITKKDDGRSYVKDLFSAVTKDFSDKFSDFKKTEGSDSIHIRRQAKLRVPASSREEAMKEIPRKIKRVKELLEKEFGEEVIIVPGDERDLKHNHGEDTMSDEEKNLIKKKLTPKEREVN